MRTFAMAAVLAALCAGMAVADDIVTMPTANQLKAGEVDLAAYYLDLDLPAGAPRSVSYQTLYLGLTDQLELDIHRADIDRDRTSLVLVGSYKALSETPQDPDIVLGIRNLNGAATTYSPLSDKSRDRSYFIAMAKTFFAGAPERPPLARFHVGLGTSDYTLMNEKRHQGFFGGWQFLFHPAVGAVAQFDGRNWITGLTIMPPKTGLTLKGGTYGDHSWFGLAYRRSM